MCWNLLDGWPQTSNGFVDYYFNKKIVFEAVKRVQTPICLSCAEPENGTIKVIGVNEYLDERTVQYRIIDMDSHSAIKTGTVVLEPNAATPVEFFDYDGKQRCYKIEFESNGQKYFNHYLAGNPAFDFKVITSLYEQLGLVNLEKFK